MLTQTMTMTLPAIKLDVISRTCHDLEDLRLCGNHEPFYLELPFVTTETLD